MPIRFILRDIALFERPVKFARPFRFGLVTVSEASQLFVRAEIALEGGGHAVGASAETLAPKWFDKRGHISPEASVDQLRRSLAIARELYLQQAEPSTAFALHRSCIEAQYHRCDKEDIPLLAAAFGPAELDKAILDAVLRAARMNFFEGMAANVAAIDARLSPDLADHDIYGFLASRRRVDRVAVRHTVGLDDTIEGAGGIADPAENFGARFFKLKLCGNPDRDAARLAAIGGALARLPYDCKMTLDANEQYADLQSLHALTERLDRDAALRSVAARLLYIEQPLPREITRRTPLGSLASRDFIIDEADDSYDAFPAALRLGYRGISSKSCKGLYKSIINAVRAEKYSRAGQGAFVSSEDLTCQAGLAVQQDLALGAFLGVSHAERNGHHYVDGFANTPLAEAEAFCDAHPDLYRKDGGTIRLAIADGDLLTGSLTAPGFASAVHPDWSVLSPLPCSRPPLQEHTP